MSAPAQHPAPARPATPALGERVREWALLACALTAPLTGLALLLVLARGVPALLGGAPVGLAPLLLGTLLTTAIASAVAIPLGLLAAIYLAEYATPGQRRVLDPILELLAGVPTVAFGLFALVFLTPQLSRLVPGLAELNALSPGIVIGVLIAPIIASLSATALAGVPGQLREAAWALGAGELRTIVGVVIPAARRGIAAAIVLAVSRALGETMIVTIAAGTRASLTLDPRAPVATLSAALVELAQILAEAALGPAMLGVGAALFALTFVTNLVGQRLSERAREGAR